MCTSRFPVFDRTDAPANLNRLVRFTERRNLVSAREPFYSNWRLPKLIGVTCPMGWAIGYWNVGIDKMSYMGSAGIVWLLECVN